MAAVTTLQAVGAAERRQAARRRGAQHLPVLAGVHGVVRAPLHPAQRADGRRLLRHDARAHPPDQGGGARRWRRPWCGRTTPRRPRRRVRTPPADAAIARAAGRARAEVAARARAGARARSSSPSSCCRRAAIETEQVDRARARAEDRTASTSSTSPTASAPARGSSALSLAVLIEQQAGHRDAAALLLPRSQPARHPVRSARRARDGAAQPAAHHRRSRAASATIPTRRRCSTSTRSA